MLWLLFVAVSVILLSYCIYEFFSSKEDPSKKYVQKVPGVPFFGLGFKFLGKSSEEMFQMMLGFARQYDGLARGRAANTRIILVSLPDHIESIVSDNRFFEKSDEYNFMRPWLQDGLLTIGNIKKWRSRRKVLTPAFHFKILEEFIEVMDHQANIFVKILENEAGKSAIDICDYVNLYTLDVICETSMGVSVNAQANKESKYVKAVLQLSNVLTQRQINIFYRDDRIWRWAPLKKEHDELVKIIHEFSISVIEKRRKEKTKFDVNSNNHDEDLGIKRRMALLDILLESKIDGQHLTTRDIQEEVDTFMFAGHDTTTSAIEFLLYNLAKYPEVQDKVYNEVIDVFGEDFSEPVTLTKLNNLNYLDLVIKESLRMYPPVAMIARYLREDVEINGITYPADYNVILFIYALHRDEKYHKNANQFIPERFLEQKSHETMNAFSYIPFSAGSRNCIGQKFAQYEIKTVISKIIHKLQVKVEPNFNIRYSSELILRSINGIHLELLPRK